jgi:putative membrane protein
VEGSGVEDASRRTRLANERTYLAWYRTGLTALAVGIGIGRVVPVVTDSSSTAYEVVGAGYGALGIGLFVAGFLRSRNVEEALNRGDYAPFSYALSLGLAVVGVALGAATFLLVLFYD